MENKNEIARIKENISQKVLKRINQYKESGELKIHENYSPENALKSAYLLLSEIKDSNKKPVLESCTPTSIANSLLEMIVKGLSPFKNQIYFIAYAGKLTAQESYLGKITRCKRGSGLVNIVGKAIYEKEVKDKNFLFTIINGICKVLKHDSCLNSLSTPVAGAYAILTFKDGSTYTEIMNIKQITAAWNQRKGNGLSPAHKNFEDQMAVKTVINRAIKIFLNSSDDSQLFESENSKETIINQTISENANKQEIDIETIPEAEIIEKEPVKEVIEEIKKELFEDTKEEAPFA